MKYKNVRYNQQLSEDVEFMPIISLSEDEYDGFDEKTLPQSVPLIPLKNTVLYPTIVLPITVSREKSIKAITEAYQKDKWLAVVTQKDASTEEPTGADLESIGTLAKIIKIIKMPDGGTTAILQGKRRIAVTEFEQSEPYFKVQYELLTDIPAEPSSHFTATVAGIKDIATQIILLTTQAPTEAEVIIKNIENPVFLINFVSSNLSAPIQDKQSLLEIGAIDERADKLLALLQIELQYAELKNKVTSKTRTELDKQQREYFLQQQLKAIKDELGGENGAEIKMLQSKAEKKKWPASAKEMFQKNIEKLERMHPSTPDYSVVYNHLDLMLELPWESYTPDNYDLKNAQQVLDVDHYGMQKIKERILEYIAVLKLRGDMKSPILCFVGPPGIGKTSLGKSIASALNRQYIRLSLGGLHDESEIRGHRKTYIGAMPGRIIQSIKKAKSSNPVVILDEIDKLDSNHRGDPSSAMLEVLDPEQNSAFYDNYLELEYDLSKVLFIATANNLNSIPAPLRDRLEIIDLSGYATEEKVEIAKRHLIPKQKKLHGIDTKKVSVSDTVLQKIITNYTRESGVRELDRQIGSVMRKLAKNYVLDNEFKGAVTATDVEQYLGKPVYTKDRYTVSSVSGVAVGLAWTAVGGDILFIEAQTTQGKGGIYLSGNLGNVMKESANTAFTWVKANAQKLGIDAKAFDNKAIHIHVPEGATPKDGPSAGITMASAITSAFMNKKVKPYTAMTGEITLRGQILPVGGIKEKVLAAKRSGIKEVILSEENKKDVTEIESSYIQGLNFTYVRNMTDVIEAAFK